MRIKILFLVFVAALAAAWTSSAAEPLRVFIRGGVKTHGPNQHDHPRFLGDWTRLLGERGMTVAGAMTFPTGDQLAKTDVVVIYAADGMKITGNDRANFEKFLQRGGGVVVIHDGIVADDQHDWCKKIVGGTWIWGNKAPGRTPTKWFEGNVGLYFVDQEHPITRGVSNFDWKDEVYNQLEMAPDAHVLAMSFIDVFNVHPQLWTYEKTLDGGSKPYRAFVSLPGHDYDVFNTPHYRAILLRGIAWAGQRANADEFCNAAELGSLRYPEGGPLPSEKAVTKLNPHPEFNVSVVADENVAEKIMSIDWDAKGRMWIVETPEYPGGRDVNKNDFKQYPNRLQEPEKFPVGGKVDRKPKDRISFLEDTNGDGVMDKKTVFADGLELPTSLVFYKDGVIVSQAPDILWIRDTDGDGKADKTEVLYTGWGINDTHAVINNLRWGMDGWVYGTVGYTRGKDVRSPKTGKNFGDFSAGMYRFRPDGSAVEQISANGCNTWGCEIAPDGEYIYTTATCGTPILHVVLPEKYLARGSVGGHPAWQNVIEENKIYPAFDEKRQPYVQIDWVGAWTAAAGATIYDGGAWPAKWAPDERYSFFMGEATRQLFHHEFLDPKGATFQGRKEEGRKQTEFMASTDYWFRPIHSRVGPDGAIYLVDFYNQIAVHNDTRGPGHGARNAAARPDRDHRFTRIYRIQHKEAKALPPAKFDAKKPAELVKLLDHPNGWTRGTANRLLNETQPAAAVKPLAALLNSKASKFSRIHALQSLNNLGKLDEPLLLAALKDNDPAIRKNAAKLAAERDSLGKEATASLRAQLKDSNDRVRINALMALGSQPATKEIAEAVVAAWPSLNGPFMQSAAVGAAAKDPVLFVEATLASKDAANLVGLVPHLARLVANKQDGGTSARFVAALAAAPASVDALKRVALDAFAPALRGDAAPAWSASLEASLKSLLASDGTAGSVLPLVAKWDSGNQLASAVKPAITRAEAQLADKSLSDEARGQIAANLIGVRKADATIVPAVAGLIGGDASLALQRRVLEVLGADPETATIVVGKFGSLPAELVEPAFSQILKRGDTTLALVEQLALKNVDIVKLGPARQHRLRTHPDLAVAKRAGQVIDELKGPEAKEKDAIIAKLSPEVVKPGNLENGKKLFTAQCAACHVYKDEGRNLAPSLTGMGAHGPADLLVHIVDPNRLVEPNFVSTAIETKDDQSFDGIIERENASEVVLRNAAADYTIRVSNIKSRTSTGRSLMPEGFEQLGAEGLRDLLAYICADESRFRLLDLTKAFTANNSRGLFVSPDNREDTISFRKYGLQKAGDVPFDIISPDKAVANVVVLKGGAGGSWSRRTLPQSVEVPVGVAAGQLHFLGGVAGWGFPLNPDVDAAKVTVHFAGGGKEVITLKNGVEFADYNGRSDVPGSKMLENWIRGRGQVRWFSKPVRGTAVIEKLTIESFDNGVAPVLFAVTADTERTAVKAGAPAAKPAARVFEWTKGIKTLVVGGGSSHDFDRFFNLADKKTLEEGGFASVNYTENFADMAANMKAADVLQYNTNKEIKDPAEKQSILDHLAAGKGMVIIHAGAWHNQPGWPEFNREIVGGGSRGHDRLGEFEVKVTNAAHPVMKDVPASFRLVDELYYLEPDAKGTPIESLAEAHSSAKNKTYPIVHVVKHPKARIVVITLGHDARAHDLDAYKNLLKNSIAWVNTVK